ncbi:hypothetical protein L204_103026 [Cryptococcus depauperatus]|nr:hypothetical protein L204_00228 [Cryptococcus depauperatus CBS 7855]
MSDMEMYQAASTQQPAAICALKSPVDAIHVLEAVRLGLVPRVTRRLTGHERSFIRPGTVWVWEEEETNMRRWTDGRRWGASRVGGGGFLVYTESSESLSPPPRQEYGNGYYDVVRRPESLIKQTYSTTMTHPVTGKVKKFHVVAYSSKHNPQGDAHNLLPLPYQLPALRNLKVQSGVWPEWETRREVEYSNTRRVSNTNVRYEANPRSNPTTAVSSPVSHSYPAHELHTAYPSPYPRQDVHGRSLSSQFHSSPYVSPGPAPILEGTHHPIGKYSQPYQSPRRNSSDFSPAGSTGYPPRYTFQPQSVSGSYSNGSTSKRYHPYTQTSRGSDHRVISAPSIPAELSPNPAIPGEQMRDIEPYPQPWMNVPRGSPIPQYPHYFFRSDENGKDRQHYQGPPSSGVYDDYGETKYPFDKVYDSRRYSVASPEQALYAHRGMSSYGTSQPTTMSAPFINGSFQRSPKAPLASSMLNNATNSAGVTLPPLRSAFGEAGLSDSGTTTIKISPNSRRTGSEGRTSRSPSDVKPMLQNSWGEDARQLGEIGRRVVL